MRSLFSPIRLQIYPFYIGLKKIYRLCSKKYRLCSIFFRFYFEELCHESALHVFQARAAQCFPLVKAVVLQYSRLANPSTICLKSLDLSKYNTFWILVIFSFCIFPAWWKYWYSKVVLCSVRGERNKGHHNILHTQYSQASIASV